MGIKTDVTRRFILLETGEEMSEVRTINEGGKAVQVREPFTLRLAMIRSLISPLDSDKSESSEKKLDRYLLAKRVKENDFVNLSNEEIKTIKDRIAQGWPGAEVSGQAAKMLDISIAESKKKKD